MRYSHEKPDFHTNMYGKTYYCNHPLYTTCTLYLIGNKGLAVIQQRFDTNSKCSFWSFIDPWLTDELYLNSKFKEFFDKYSSKPIDGLYPTVTIRQIMWALRMKPLKKSYWETYFDKKPL